jgi:Tfp pilus assembly protein PilZ
MNILVARFGSGAEFLEHYEGAFPYGGLFHPTRKVIATGELVVIDVRMPSLRDYTLIRGMVAWHRRARRSDGTRAGLGIEFLASERATRDYLLSVARGDNDPQAQRRHRRLPTEIRVDWRLPNQSDRRASVVGDIGAGGLFLRTNEPPPAGASLLLEMVPPGALTPQTIEGRVVWIRETPGSEGAGVEFRCRDIGGMRRLRELVRRIEQTAEVQLS